MMATRISFFAVIFSLLFASPGFAQMQVGPKMGLNLATVSGDVSGETGFDKSAKAGLLIGGAFNFNVSDNLSIQPSLLYSQKGVNVGGIVTAGLNYLEIPVSLLGVIRPSDKLFIRFGGGPYLGILVSDNNFGADNSVDAGLTLKTGVGIAELGPGDIIFEPSFNLGLTKIVESNNESIRNNVFALSVYYLFNL